MFHEKYKKITNRNFLKKNRKIQFFEENQCRTLLYFVFQEF